MPEIRRPYTPQELQPNIDWQAFGVLAQNFPQAQLFYELICSQPQTSGHDQFLAILRERKDERLKTINELEKTSPQFKAIIENLSQTGMRRKFDTLFPELLKNPHIRLTETVLTQILLLENQVGASLKSTNRYWQLHATAYSLTEKSYGRRPILDGQNITPAGRERLLTRQSFWDQCQNQNLTKLLLLEDEHIANLDEQCQALIHQTELLQEKVFRDTMIKYFNQQEFFTCPPPPNNFMDGQNWLYYRTGNCQPIPLTLEDFKKLKVHVTSNAYFWFEDMKGEETLVMIRNGVGWTPVVDLTACFLGPKYPSGKRPLNPAETDKVTYICRSLLNYLNLIKASLGQKNFPQLFERATAFFSSILTTEPNSALRDTLTPSASEFIEAFASYESPTFFADRALMTTTETPSLVSIFEKIPIPDYAPTFNQSTHLPDNESPWNKDYEKFQQQQREILFSISYRQLPIRLVTHLDFPLTEDINDQDFMPVLISNQPGNMIITSQKAIHADEQFIRLPLPLFASVTKLSLILQNDSQLTSLDNDEYELWKNPQTGHQILKLKNPDHHYLAFHYSVELDLPNEPLNAVEFPLARKALRKMVKYGELQKFSYLVNNLKKLITQKKAVLKDLELAVQNSTIYSFDSRYTYRRWFDSTFQRLSGLLDWDGIAHLQCDGADKMLQATIELYAVLSGENLVARSGPCVAVDGPKATLADLHTRTHVFHEGQRIAILDATPFIAEAENMSAGEILNLKAANKYEAESLTSRQQEVNELKKLIQEIQANVSTRYGNQLTTRLDKSDPIWMCLQLPRILHSPDSYDLQAIIEALDQKQKMLMTFNQKLLNNPQLLQKNPHYQNVTLINQVLLVLEKAREVLGKLHKQSTPPGTSHRRK